MSASTELEPSSKRAFGPQPEIFNGVHSTFLQGASQRFILNVWT